jgi:hypothetical protein
MARVDEFNVAASDVSTGAHGHVGEPGVHLPSMQLENRSQISIGIPALAAAARRAGFPLATRGLHG